MQIPPLPSAAAAEPAAATPLETPSAMLEPATARCALLEAAALRPTGTELGGAAAVTHTAERAGSLHCRRGAAPEPLAAARPLARYGALSDAETALACGWPLAACRQLSGAWPLAHSWPRSPCRNLAGTRTLADAGTLTGA